MKLKELIILSMFSLGIIGIIISTSIFYISFHNIDLSMNMCVLSNQYGYNFYEQEDFYEVGKSMKYTDLYIISNKSQEMSFYAMLLSGLLLGISLSHLGVKEVEDETDKKGKKNITK